MLDQAFKTTPRALMTLVSAFLAIAVPATTWVYSEFALASDLEEIQTAFEYHVEEQTILRLEERLQDTSDLRWELKQRMEAPGGDTIDNKDRDRELKKREERYRQQIQCLRNKGAHCLDGLG